MADVANVESKLALDKTLMMRVVKKMAKNKPKHNNAMPKADIEFAEERGNGFEKVALKAQKKQNK